MLSRFSERQNRRLFQIESPGQWNLLARSQPEHFNDLIAQVVLVRPGPLQANMVHPYIGRRRGWLPTTFPHPSLERALRDTYGLIFFQEQVLEVAHYFAGMPLGEADQFRSLMSKFRDSDEMESMRERFDEGARLLGITVLPPCVLWSGVTYGLENLGDELTIRVSLCQIESVSPESATNIVTKKLRFDDLQGTPWLYFKQIHNLLLP